MAGSPELDDAPGVEVAADVVASPPSLTKTVHAEDRRQKAGKAQTVATTDEIGGGGGGGAPTDSSSATAPPAPSPIWPCRGSSSATSTKHASSGRLKTELGTAAASPPRTPPSLLL
jgi:hypothetical protein